MADPRGDVGMGDALRAAHDLGLAGEDLGTLAELLGLVTPAGPDVAPDELTPATPDTLPTTAEVAATAGLRLDTTAAATVTRHTDHRPRTVVEPLPATAVGVVTDDGDPPLDLPSGDLPTVPYEPPVPDHRLRPAISTLLSQPRASLRPDVHALVAIVTSCRPIRELPREVEPSLSRGTDVVADVGPGMLPYRADVTHLVEQVRQVVGAPNVRVTWLSDAGERTAPPGDRPVLVISALGRMAAPSAAPGGRRRWRRLVERLVAEGRDVVVAVPHRATADDLSAAGVHAVAWDDLPDAGRGRA
jgi:hypothetical protein